MSFLHTGGKGFRGPQDDPTGCSILWTFDMASTWLIPQFSQVTTLQSR
jgi:hypothetical protein